MRILACYSRNNLHVITGFAGMWLFAYDRFDNGRAIGVVACHKSGRGQEVVWLRHVSMYHRVIRRRNNCYCYSVLVSNGSKSVWGIERVVFCTRCRLLN